MSTDIPQSDFHKRIRKSFPVFLDYAHKQLGLPKPTRIQLDIALYLQSGPRRSVVEAFRGVGKSHITSLYVIWLLLRNPLLNILVVSASKQRADQFSIFVQGLINTMPGLEYLQAIPGQRSSTVSFDVGPAGIGRQFPSVRAAGITGQITGGRADVIIADDVEIPKNSLTQIMRDRLSEAVKEFGDILKPLEASRIIYLGTPQCEDSLYTKLPERGYEIRVWPAEVPAEKEMIHYGNRLAPIIKLLGLPEGAPVDPAWFDEAELLTKKAEGLARYQMQYMLSTRMADADRYPLKVKDILFHPMDTDRAPMRFGWGPNPDRILNELANVAMSGDKMYAPMMVDEEWSAYTGVVMAIDPAGRGADETGYAVVKHLNGYLHVIESSGLQGGYEVNVLEELARIAKRHGVNEIVVEANFGDGMWLQLFKPIINPIHACKLTEVRHSTQKERRIIDTLEPVMGTHRLVMDPSVVSRDYDSIQKYDAEIRQTKSLIYQLTRITTDRGSLKHDDRLDALAMAVAYWVEKIGGDHDKGVAAKKKKDLLDAVNRIKKTAVDPTGRKAGRKAKRKAKRKTNWFRSLTRR